MGSLLDEYIENAEDIETIGNVKTESLKVRTNSWTEESDYPYALGLYCMYAVVSYQDSFFYFGGWHVLSTASAVIAKFDSTTRQWSHIGSLREGRTGHGAIFDGAYFLIIGGTDQYYTERCSLDDNDSAMVCSQQEPRLYKYSDYPELFLVPGNFCKID